MRDKSDLIRKHPIMGIDDMHRGVIASEHLSELPLSDRFRNMSFVCAVMVVAIHLTHGMAGWGRWYDSLYRHGVGRMAVPFFFLASGYFLACKVVGVSGFRTAIRKRIRTLFVPYLLWQLIWVAWLCLCVGANVMRTGGAFSQYWLYQGWSNLSLLGLHYGQYPAMGLLWYVRALLLLVVISPVLFFLVRRFGAWSLLLLYALELAGAIWSMPWNVIGMLLPMQAVFFFGAGCYLCDRRALLVQPMPRAWLLVVVGFLLCLLKVYTGGGALVHIAAPFLIVGVWQIMGHVTISRKLTDNSFALYLIHPFVLVCWQMVIGRSRQSVLLLILEFVFALVSSFGIIFLLRRFFPKITNVLLGGR